MADRELCTGKPMKIWDCFSVRAGMCGASAVYPGQCSGSREWSHQQVLVLIRRTTPWGFYDSFFRQAFWKPTYFYSGVCPGSNLTVTLRRGEWGWCLWLLRLQGTPFLERKILLYQARELRPVGLGATPFDKETHILFASQPLSLKGFARVKCLKQVMPGCRRTWPLRFWGRLFFFSNRRRRAGWNTGGRWATGRAAPQTGVLCPTASFPRHGARSELIPALHFGDLEQKPGGSLGLLVLQVTWVASPEGRWAPVKGSSHSVC